jgi:hypothetical protein
LRWLTSSIAFVRGRSGAELALAFALSTFQAGALVVLIVALLFRGGSLGETLDDLDTSVGVAVFAWLWLTGFYCTLKAVVRMGLQSLRDDPLPDMLAGGIVWGGTNGVLFFLGVLLALVLYGAANFDSDGEPVLAAAVSALAFAMVAVVIGSVVAWVFGAAAGFVFAVVHRVLLQLAKAVAGPG